MTKETKWSVDPAHSDISFKVKHLMISHVKGHFKKFDANIYTVKNDFSTVDIDLWIDAGSISTGDEKRDEHLRGADFFDVANHKQLTFQANTMGLPDADSLQELWGDLTIKGITKKILLYAEFGGILNDPWGNERVGFSVTGKINRSDWELTWNSLIETGGIMISNEIYIACEIELTKVNADSLKMELVTALDNPGVY